MALEPSECVPKKLSICPSAIITAIPEVNPVMTGAGIYETSLPIFKRAARMRMIPEIH